MNTDTTIKKLKEASIHVFYPSKEDAQRESFRTGDPYFRTYINGQELHGVRPQHTVK